MSPFIKVTTAILAVAILCLPATANKAKRLVSLAPSNTELLYSLGAEKSLVGVSTYCDFPPEAEKLDKAGSFVSANIERMSRLKPDLIVLVKGQEALASLLKRKGFNVLILPNDHLNQIPSNLATLGELTGTRAASQHLQTEFNSLLKRFTEIVSTGKQKPRVFFCVWPKPLLTVGTNSFLNELIVTAGGINIAASNISYPHFSLEKLVLANPDLIILPFEAGNESFVRKSPWSSLRAIKTHQFYFLPKPKDDRLSRPTLRITEGLYWLAIRLHPELKPALDSWISDCRIKLGTL